MATSREFGGSRSTLVLRLITAVLLVLMCVYKLHLTYRGLNQPVAMEQAQIARSVAQGKGFVTGVLRPIEVMNAAEHAKQKKLPLDYQSMRDSTHAPLNIVAMAVALKMTGYDDFEASRMTDGGYVYAPDRIISATSIFFFCIAIVLTYTLVGRLFDEVVACSTCCFLLLSELVLNYAVSGLPQPLMMCFMLGGLHLFLSSVRMFQEKAVYWSLLYLSLSFACMGLMCLSGWMGIWIAGGLLLFCCFYYRPAGSYVLTSAVVLLLILLGPAVFNYINTGSILGNAMLGLYNSFGGGEEYAMRAASLNYVPLQAGSAVLNLLAHTVYQLRDLYVNMGSILVVPFFFLALLNRFKRDDVQSMKWALFSMWAIACVGMALFGQNEPECASQLAIMFVPMFVAYGIALVFNFLGRLKYESSTFNQARGLAIFILIILSAGPFLATLPKALYMGIWLGDRGRPQYPPYYPPALNVNLANITAPEHVIVTDQPWAVAWYANRKALWIPRTVYEFSTALEPTLKSGGAHVTGFLITPSSHSRLDSTGGMSAIEVDMGDFAPLAVEGKILKMVPRHNVALADFFVENVTGNQNAYPLGQLVSSQGRFSRRVPLLGAEILYYGEPDGTPAN